MILGISNHDGIILADMVLKAQINKKLSQTVPIWNKADWGKLKKAAVFTNDFLRIFEGQNIHDNWKEYTRKTQYKTSEELCTLQANQHTTLSSLVDYKGEAHVSQEKKIP